MRLLDKEQIRTISIALSRVSHPRFAPSENSANADLVNSLFGVFLVFSIIITLLRKLLPTVTCVIISIAKSVFILICREAGFFKDRLRLFLSNLHMNHSNYNILTGCPDNEVSTKLTKQTLAY